MKSVLFYKKGKSSGASEDIDPVCHPTEIAKKVPMLLLLHASMLCMIIFIND